MSYELVNKKILFIGCGKMGSAIVKNLLTQGLEYPQFTILKPSKKNVIVGVKYISSYQELPKDYKADIIFFAFKPQVAEVILSDFVKANIGQKILHPQTIFISILAGKKVNFFEKILGKKSKIIRLMPNLPTTINEGILGCYFNQNINNAEIEFLNKIAHNIVVDKEELIDTITAISGSGPAYLFLFAQSMIEAAVKLGLNKQLAKKLVEQTIYGSSKLLINDDLNELIKSVSSKGGTTEIALEILQKDDQFKKIIFEAIEAGNKRAKELSK